MRIYKVEDAANKVTVLVQANSQAAALRTVTAKQFSVAVASGLEVARMIQQGVAVLGRENQA
jgi:diaminopimelate decarboxylase